MRRFQFTLSEMLWLVLLVGLGCAAATNPVACALALLVTFLLGLQLLFHEGLSLRFAAMLAFVGFLGVLLVHYIPQVR